MSKITAKIYEESSPLADYTICNDYGTGFGTYSGNQPLLEPDASEKKKRNHSTIFATSQFSDISLHESTEFYFAVVCFVKMSIGCEHYQRKVTFLAPCCNKVYGCRFCHDDNEDHFINRKAIVTVICLHCNYPQEVGHTCLRCKKKMAEYFCLKCTLYDDKGIEKGTAHCNKCDCCRCYLSYRNKFYHCDNCTICRHIDTKYTHRCFKITEEDECSKCSKRMRSARDTFVTPPCAHFIHQKCYDSLKEKDCPKCHEKIM